ncbi:ImmA/IrrE family metallo-endopeptidase [Candidatus Saccharibacteria bacterium]|nr:MAG: ImmA/IrrE family metallo-endopeptidase [Candidatus Saccharibacteria bacterium]
MPLNRLSLQRQAEITDLVNALTLHAGMAYPEAPLKKLIQDTIPDVLIREDDFDGNSHVKGAVFRKSKTFPRSIIAIQSNQTKRSKTFSLAHEFGHYVLKHNPSRNYYIDDMPFDGTKHMQDEAEANFFAQTLLMPRDVFMKVDKPFVSDQSIADFFGVSESVVRVRREWLKRNGY